MVRLIILVLIIIGGIWMFRACENDTEKVEFTEKEQSNERSEKQEQQSAREAQESREEKTARTESKKDDQEGTTLAGKDDKKDSDTGMDKEEDSDKKSWSEKLVDKLTGGDKKDSEASTDTETGSVAPQNESTYGTMHGGSHNQAEVAAEVVVPDRDSHLKVYVYENAVDTFGKPPSTGRVHLEVTNSGDWSQNVSILDYADLGKVRSGETVLFTVEFSEAGLYYIQSHSAKGGAERQLPVVE